MNKIRIGMDFDGCINRLPYPFRMFSRYLDHSFIVPSLVMEIMWKIIVRIPIILDGRLLEIPKDVELYIITGRRDPSRVVKALKNYPIKVLVRGQSPVTELEFKVVTAKAYKLDYFFDDRLKIIAGLKKHGIQAHDIRELVK